MNFFKGTGIYLIKESLHSKAGLPTLGNTIGPSGIQIVKSVYHLMTEYDAFYEGRPINYEGLSLWDKFKVIFGVDIIERIKPGGNVTLHYEYCGFTTFITPLDGFDRFLPEWFSAKHRMGNFNLFQFGHDPVKNINLYRNSKASFFIDNGGEGIPTAFGKYNSKSKEMVYIRSEKEFMKTIRDIKGIKRTM